MSGRGWGEGAVLPREGDGTGHRATTLTTPDDRGRHVLVAEAEMKVGGTGAATLISSDDSDSIISPNGIE